MGLLLIVMHDRRNDHSLSYIACNFFVVTAVHRSIPTYAFTVRAAAAMLTSMNVEVPFPTSPQQPQSNLHNDFDGSDVMYAGGWTDSIICGEDLDRDLADLLDARDARSDTIPNRAYIGKMTTRSHFLTLAARTIACSSRWLLLATETWQKVNWLSRSNRA